MHSSQLGHIILSGGSSSSDEMRVNASDAAQLDELLAEISASAVKRDPDADPSSTAEY